MRSCNKLTLGFLGFISAEKARVFETVCYCLFIGQVFLLFLTAPAKILHWCTYLPSPLTTRELTRSKNTDRRCFPAAAIFSYKRMYFYLPFFFIICYIKKKKKSHWKLILANSPMAFHLAPKKTNIFPKQWLR